MEMERVRVIIIVLGSMAEFYIAEYKMPQQKRAYDEPINVLLGK